MVLALLYTIHTHTYISLQHNVTVQGVTVQAVTEPIDIARLLNIGESKYMYMKFIHQCIFVWIIHLQYIYMYMHVCYTNLAILS